MASSEEKAYERARADANNADNIRNAASVAQASGHPVAAAIGTGVKAADKITGGKATELLGKSVTQSAKFVPGAQKGLNALNESGIGDKIGKAAEMKAAAGGGSAGGSAGAKAGNAAGAKAGAGKASTAPSKPNEMPKQGGIDSKGGSSKPSGSGSPSSSGGSSSQGNADYSQSPAERRKEAANRKDLSNKVSNAKNAEQDDNQRDIDAIRNRQTNQADHNSAYRPASVDREREAEQRLQQSQQNGAGAQAQETQANASSDGKSKKEIENDAREDIDEAKEEAPQRIKAKIIKAIKRRIAIFVIISTVLILLPIFFISIYVALVDNVIGSISSFFGISEADTKPGLSVEKADGLLTSEKLQYDPETGIPYTREELVTKLKEDNDCKANLISNIRDWFDGWDGNLSSVCANIRHIQKYEEKREKEIKAKGIDITLDRGLILSAVFYGFTKQPEYNDYVNPESVKEMVPATEHFATLKNIINEGDILEIEDLDDLIDYSILDGSYDYYAYNPLALGDKCEEKHVDVYYYSSDKWKTMMRYSKKVADEYEKVIQNNSAIEATDPECKYKLKVQEPKNENTFLVHADIESGEVDKLEPAEGLEGKVPLVYKNGYIYEKFPYYKKSIEDPQINLKYDDVITPKDIETTIVYLFSKKVHINEILLFEDQDEKFKSQLGPYIYGAYCGNYLTAPIDAISVRVTDCDGNFIKNTSFKDYIMGVAYGEVSDSGENYVKSEMVAAISYSLKRRNNYDKGSYITMRSGNCDQVYCSMLEGCYAKKANINCGGFKCTSYLPGGGTYHRAASESLIQKYSEYYDEAADYLVVKDDKPFSAHYVSSIQKGWKRKSDAGMHFSQIIAEEYGDEGAAVVRCSEEENETNGTTTGTTSGTTNGTGPSNHSTTTRKTSN